MKKIALTLTLILGLLFLVAGVFFVNLVKGNFYPPGRIEGENIEPLPGTSPPKITILNPKNHTTCMISEVNLAVDVSMPETTYSAEFDPLSVTYLLDSEYLADLVVIERLLHTLGGGAHQLEVRAECVVHPTNSTYFYSTSTSTVYFTIENTQSPSSEPESFPTSLVIASSVTVAAVCVGLGLLVYLMKRK